MRLVDQPAPSVNCGTVTAPTVGGADKSVTGSGVARKSPRLFETPRKATTLTGSVAENEIVPSVPIGALNGASLRNFAVCPFAGMVKAPLAKSLPDASVKKKCDCHRIGVRIRHRDTGIGGTADEREGPPCLDGQRSRYVGFADRDPIMPEGPAGKDRWQRSCGGICGCRKRIAIRQGPCDGIRQTNSATSGD